MASRIEQLTPDMHSEIIATMTQFGWDPKMQDGQIVFNMAKYLYTEPDKLITSVPPAYCGMMHSTIGALAGRQFAPVGTVDPVTGADLSQISVGGVLAILKIAFDTLYNEKTTADDNALLDEANAINEYIDQKKAEAAAQAASEGTQTS